MKPLEILVFRFRKLLVMKGKAQAYTREYHHSPSRPSHHLGLGCHTSSSNLVADSFSFRSTLTFER